MKASLQVIGLMSVFLMGFSSCEKREDIPQVPQCKVPTISLSLTPIPARTARTNQELLVEAEALRAALVQCNADKQDTFNVIQESFK